MKTALFAIPALIILAGCVSRDDKEIAEIRASLEKQNADIAALRAELEEFNKTPEKSAEIRQEKMLAAAILLARGCPDKYSAQAIQILASFEGEKTEEALLDILENSSENKYRFALNALGKIKSKKLRGIVIKELSSGSSKHLNDIVSVLQNSSKNIFNKEDLPLIEKILSEFDDVNYEDNRHICNCLIGVICRLDQEKGIKLACRNLLLPVQPYTKRELIYRLTDNTEPLKIESWINIMRVAGNPADNVEVWRAIMERMSRSGDWRVTDLILPYIEAMPSNYDLLRSFTEALNRLKDPKAAKTFLTLCNKNKKSPHNYLDNYPGIKKDGSKYVLVDDETMKGLMEKRAKKIEYLNEIDKKTEN